MRVVVLCSRPRVIHARGAVIIRTRASIKDMEARRRTTLGQSPTQSLEYKFEVCGKCESHLVSQSL